LELLTGLKLMIIGMTVVFCFLALLVLAMSVSARFFKRFAHYFPEEEPSSLGPTKDLTAVAIAIAAAQTRMRS
jgi:sodium pump decarboxylase gamma subunit